MAEDKGNDVSTLMDECEANGVAVTSVTDGHVLVFKRAHLQKLLHSLPADKETLVIFVKSPKAN